MTLDRRKIAVVVAGFCAFLNMYSTQSLLPELQAHFHASVAETSLTLSATTLAVALVAPLAGGIADCYGRRRIMLWAIFAMGLSTLLLAFAPSLDGIIALRFLIGLCIPGIFTSALAYIGEEWPTQEVTKVTSLYVSGNVLGGFCGRFLTGLLTARYGWHEGVLGMGLLTLVFWPVVWLWLPRPRHFQASRSVRASLAGIGAHVREPALVATFGLGFCILFTQMATFTYVGFHLAQPPFRLNSAQIGTIFAIYLIGMVITPITGTWANQFGRHRLLLGAMALAILGMLATLAPNLWVILFGLTLSSAAVFACQAAATSFIPKVARLHRSTAVGLYLTCYYFGGSVGATSPSLLWARYHWAGCVGLVILVQLFVAWLGYHYWGQYEESQQQKTMPLLGKKAPTEHQAG